MAETEPQPTARDGTPPSEIVAGYFRAFRSRSTDPAGHFQTAFRDLLARHGKEMEEGSRETARRLGMGYTTLLNSRTQCGIIRWELVERIADEAGATAKEKESLKDLWAFDRMRLTRDGWLFLRVLIDELGAPFAKGPELRKLRKYRDLYIEACEEEAKG